MRVVYKYRLGVSTVLSLPDDAEIIHVGEQDNDICLWTWSDPSRPIAERCFCVLPTGLEHNDNLEHRHIGSVQMASGLVFHAFEVEVPYCG